MELEILYAIQKLHTPILDKIMVAITNLGDEGIFWIVLAILLLFFKKTRKCGIMVLLTMAVCYIVGNLGIKNIVQRQRPCAIDPAVQLLIPYPSEYSFPSGHTLHGFAAATTIFLHFKKPGIAALVLASLIAFSRMYLFVHFPTDILGGMIIGAGMAVLIYKLAERRRFDKKQAL